MSVVLLAVSLEEAIQQVVLFGDQGRYLCGDVVARSLRPASILVRLAVLAVGEWGAGYECPSLCIIGEPLKVRDLLVEDPQRLARTHQLVAGVGETLAKDRAAHRVTSRRRSMAT